jgi:hypothetical protein
VRDVEDILSSMRNNPSGIRFADARAVAEHYFGRPRHDGSSHFVWKMPWAGDPRVNLQEVKGCAKAYQIRQMLKAISKLDKKESP